MLVKKTHKQTNKTHTHCTEMKNAFDALINRLYVAEERSSELEARSIEFLKTSLIGYLNWLAHHPLHQGYGFIHGQGTYKNRPMNA